MLSEATQSLEKVLMIGDRPHLHSTYPLPTDTEANPTARPFSPTAVAQTGFAQLKSSRACKATLQTACAITREVDQHLNSGAMKTRTNRRITSPYSHTHGLVAWLGTATGKEKNQEEHDEEVVSIFTICVSFRAIEASSSFGIRPSCLRSVPAFR